MAKKIVASDYAQMLLNGVDNICIAFVVWHQLHELAQRMKITMYEVKHRLLREYQKQLWRDPAYRFDAGLLGGA